MIDREKRFPWLKDLAPGAPLRVGGMTLVAHPGGDGGLRLVSLAEGTFVIPLPEGWEFKPSGVYRGFVQMPEGLLLIELDSFEDAEAAQGGPRVLEHLGADGGQGTEIAPEEALANIQIAISPEGENDMVFTWLEPLATTHLRKLTVRYSCTTNDDIDFRTWLARTVIQWLGLGSFAEEATVLDRNASTPELERSAFQDTLLLRIPRGWKIVEDSRDDSGRILYAIDAADGRETLWVVSTLHTIGEAGDDDLASKFHAFAYLLARGKFRQAEGWSEPRQEALEDGDLLAQAERLEEENGHAFRRAAWLRIALRDNVVVTAMLDLCTHADHLDDPAQRRTLTIVDHEVRLASIYRWRPRWAPGEA